MEELINKYNSLLDDIDDLEADIDELNDEIEQHVESLNTLTKSIQNARDSISDDSPLIEKAIKEQLENAQKQNDAQVANITRMREALNREMNNNKLSICKNARDSIKCISDLQRVYDFIQEHQDIGDYPGEVVFDDIEDIQKLNSRVKQLKEHLKEYNKNVDGIINKLSNTLSLYEIFKGINNPKMSSLIMTVYILLITVVMCKLPVVVFAGYVTLTIKALIESKKRNYEMLDLQSEFTVLKKSYNNCQASIECEFEQKTAEMLDDVDIKFKSQFDQLKIMLDNIQEEYEKTLKQIEDNRNDPDMIAKILESANDKLNALLGRENKFSKAKSSAELNLQEKQEELEELRLELSELKEKIDNSFNENLTPGKERLLPDYIFMGYNSDGKASIIKHNGDALVIMYSGASSEVVEPLTVYIVSRILTQLSIASVSMNIFDINQGAMTLASYASDRLADNFIICRTADQITERVKEIHSRISYLAPEMAKIANNIKDYNEYMISKNSLTLDYTFIIAQDYGENLFKDPKFIQLCKSGPKLGIIPIIFLSMNTLSNLVNSGSSNSIEGYYQILTTVTSQFYKFENNTGDIYLLDNRIKEDYVSSLEKLMRRS